MPSVKTASNPKSNPKPRERRALAATNALATASGLPKTAEQAAATAATLAEDKVTVTVPKAFTLTLDDHQVIEIAAGVQPMPKSWAEHWFSKAKGVTVYKG